MGMKGYRMRHDKDADNTGGAGRIRTKATQ
jgi:hypothetical protein